LLPACNPCPNEDAQEESRAAIDPIISPVSFVKRNQQIFAAFPILLGNDRLPRAFRRYRHAGATSNNESPPGLAHML
jgi:hypothetical protein